MSSISSTGESGSVGVVDLEVGVVGFDVSGPFALAARCFVGGSPAERGEVEGMRSMEERARLPPTLLRMMRPNNMCGRGS